MNDRAVLSQRIPLAGQWLVQAAHCRFRTLASAFGGTAMKNTARVNPESCTTVPHGITVLITLSGPQRACGER